MYADMMKSTLDTYSYMTSDIPGTLKCRQWRHGVTVWPFMVPGLIGRRETDASAPSQAQRTSECRSSVSADPREAERASPSKARRGMDAQSQQEIAQQQE